MSSLLENNRMIEAVGGAEATNNYGERYLNVGGQIGELAAQIRQREHVRVAVCVRQTKQLQHQIEEELLHLEHVENVRTRRGEMRVDGRAKVRDLGRAHRSSGGGGGAIGCNRGVVLRKKNLEPRCLGNFGDIPWVE